MMSRPPRIAGVNIPPTQAVPMPLYPTMGSMKEVIELGKSRLPIASENELFSLLMTYHNTLLAQVRAAPLSNKGFPL